MEEYIEIVHIKPSLCLSSPFFDEEDQLTAKRILNLENSANVNYNHGSLKSDNLPDVPLDTPIRIGGRDWDICVRTRVENLRDAGYINVRRDRSISFSLVDTAIRLNKHNS